MIRAVLNHYGADVSRVRPGVWCPVRCPFHGDEHESASVFTGEVRTFGAFKCHGCGVSGDAVKLIQEQEGLRFRDALSRAEEIARHFGEDIQSKSLEGNRLPGRERTTSGLRRRGTTRIRR